MRLLIIDDHLLLLQGLTSLLTQHGHAVVTACDIPDARQALTDQEPFDVALVDFHLPSGSSAQLLEDNSLRLPPIVIMLSGVAEPDDMIQMLHLGADLCLPKAIDPKRLVEIIQRIGDGQRPPKGIWDSASGQIVAADRFFPKDESLTPRERDVYMLLRKGLLDKQVAEALGMSIFTVRVHVRSIRRKRPINRRFPPG